MFNSYVFFLFLPEGNRWFHLKNQVIISDFFSVKVKASIYSVFFHNSCIRRPLIVAGWWFGTFPIFPYIGNNHPN